MKSSILSILIVLLSHSSWQLPYLQAYPPVNTSDNRSPLYFALELSSEQNYPSISAVAAVQVALDLVNNDPSLLPGYSLHYTLTDTKCQRSETVRSFLEQVLRQPSKIAWIGSGCSETTDFIAELTSIYNLTQISCGSTMSEFDPNTLWRYYIQMIPSREVLGSGFLSLLLHFHWKKVSIITFNEQVFTKMTHQLKESLEYHEIEYTETVFNDISDIGDKPYRTGARIYVWVVYQTQANHLLCEVHKRGLRYPMYQFLIFGWYQDAWYTDSVLGSSLLNCTEQERATTLEYALTVRMASYENSTSSITTDGLDMADFLMMKRMKYSNQINSHLKLSKDMFVSTSFCFEATMILAHALNETINDFDTDRTLNIEVGNAVGLTNNLITLGNISYSSTAIAQRLYHHLIETDMNVLKGRRVSFSSSGRRNTHTLEVGQYVPSGSMLAHNLVGNVRKGNGDNFSLIIHNERILWPNGTPTDGIPIINIAPVSITNVVCFSTLGVIGICYALVCMIFNFVNRQKKVIRLSSPNLNYVIVCGALILYFNILLQIIRTRERTILPIYYVNTWLLYIGNTLCFGTISSKMIRVWYIFNNPGVKKVTVKDHHLLMIVACFLVCDVFTLGLYTLIEGVRGHLTLTLVRSNEQPEELVGPTGEVHHYYFYASFSPGIFIWYIALTLQKLLLNVFALILAFQTRKVKMKGLNDSKFVIIATYATNIFFLIGTAGLISASAGSLNVFIAVFGGNQLISTTTVLSLVFVPKMVALYKDPKGEDVGGVMMQPRFTLSSFEYCEREKETLRQKIQQLESDIECHRKKLITSA